MLRDVLMYLYMLRHAHLPGKDLQPLNYASHDPLHALRYVPLGRPVCSVVCFSFHFSQVSPSALSDDVSWVLGGVTGESA